MKAARSSIDVHAHYLPPALTADGLVTVGTFRSRPVPQELTDFELRLQRMESSDVLQQVLSGWTEVLAYDQDARTAREFARRHNLELAEAVQANQGIVYGLGTVPLQEPDAAADVLLEAVRDLSLIGVQIGTHVDGVNLGDPRFEGFWSLAEQIRALILIHPAQSTVAARERLTEHYFENLLGNPFETTLAGASLIFSGVLERHPNLTVCLAHGGGFLPYQIGRLVHGANARPAIADRLTEGVLESFGRLYFDTILHDSSNLAHLVARVGADRVMLGTDYPFDMADEAAVARIQWLAVSQEDRDLILHGNARRLLARAGNVPNA